MDQETTPVTPLGRQREERSRPRPRDYFWRPWYARTWWKAAAVFWLIVAINELFIGFRPAVAHDWAFFALLLFHPFTIVPVLGFWYLRDLFEYSGFYDDPDEGQTERLYDGDGGMGFHSQMSYLSDPADIRSPLNPLNPANPHHFDRR